MLTKAADGVTTIGKAVRIKGSVSGSEDLSLDGLIEGTISLPDHSLTIGPNGCVIADVQAKNITVFGKIEGTIRVSERVDLRHSAFVKGDIYAARLSVEENAQVFSKVELRELETQERSIASRTSIGEETLFPVKGKV